MPTLDEANSIAVWGFGKEGQAALEFLRGRRPDARMTVLDDAVVPEGAANLDGVEVIQGAAEAAAAIRSGRFDVIIKSPGISLYRDEIREARQRGTRVTSGTNLWFELNPRVRKIVVTGTKGKSTTARALHHVLKGHGLKTALLGNVGIAAISQLLAQDSEAAVGLVECPDEYAVIELSSYQIADLEFAPDFAIVTNLFAEHAPWHGGVEQYFSDKLRVLRLDRWTVRICNHANEELRARVADLEDIVWFNTKDGFYVEGGALHYRGESVDCSTSPLKGGHNLSNLAAVCTLGQMLGLRDLEKRVDLQEFRQLPHRLEEFGCGNVVCVDDSISTIPEATMAALNVYANRRCFVFVGGTERGQDYGELCRVLRERRIGAVYLLPVTGERVFDELTTMGAPFPVRRVADLEEGVREAMGTAADGDVLLLSPGAPSFVQFRSFEERGRRFKALCAQYAPR